MCTNIYSAGFRMGRVLELIEEKKRILNKIQRFLDRDSIDKATKDHHSKRRPRPCGITIHTGIGCSLMCSYCYIYDMGFPSKVKPYPLTALELVYALAINPYVIPYRTFAAYGSVTEPFLPITRDIAISYIASVYKWLYLPSQVSTKMVIDEDLAKKLREAEPNISILVTVITIDKADVLEKFAPNPFDRLEGVRVASRYGLPTYLFIRPIIPGVTDKELDKIISLGVEHNVRGVVLGSLRITSSIIRRLRSKGINIHEILQRTTEMPRGSKQVTVKINDLIKNIDRLALDYGIKVFRSACMANIDAHREYCYMCDLGPCGNADKGYNVEYGDVAEYLEFLMLKFKSIEIGPNTVYITVQKSCNKGILEIARNALMHILRRKVIISVSST